MITRRQHIVIWDSRSCHVKECPYRTSTINDTSLSNLVNLLTNFTGCEPKKRDSHLVLQRNILSSLYRTGTCLLLPHSVTDSICFVGSRIRIRGSILICLIQIRRIRTIFLGSGDRSEPYSVCFSTKN